AAKKAPPAIAQEITSALPSSSLVTAKAEGPYVNFTLVTERLVETTLKSVQHWGERYGTVDPKGERVIVEHTSANPNGPFHVGRARNPIVGDTLGRILRNAGYEVTTEYYVNDMGKQVAILNWGLKNLKPTDVTEAEREKVDHRLVPYYQKANELLEKQPEVEAAINASLKRFEEGDREIAAQFREAASRVLEGMRESLSRLGVTMDNYAWESDYVLRGDVGPVVEELKKAPTASQDDTGAWGIDLTEYGISGKNPRWTFLRRDGTSLYTTRDLAYHQDKFKRADRAVNVLGEDHKLTMTQLNIALDLLGINRKPEVVWISFVSLPEGKMSTRRNRVVFIDDLLDEAVARAYEEVKKRRSEDLSEEQMARIAEAVGVGALRFNIVSVQPEKSIVFRWEDALNFEGASAPYVMYSYARASSILAKLTEERHLNPFHHPRWEKLTHESEVALVRAIARFPTAVEDAAAQLKPHAMAMYAIEVANAFNQFYRDCPVARAEDAELREARVALVRAAKTTLKNALAVLGIPALEEM
ncbi:MAG TPA: arginine--tRNA ligase, partial [Candidatus Thermoplasmatota archaeon]|nr:arginine--tRNA ligase [Candidatus Thermoplasmatota archaeon]